VDSSKQALVRSALRVHIAGFALILATVWVNEVFDLPHYVLGAEATPLNWREATLECVLIACMGVVSRIALATLLQRVKMLEGLVPMCFCCHKVRDERNEWVRLEQYIAEHSGASVSHGLCPECLQREYPDFAGDDHEPESQRDPA